MEGVQLPTPAAMPMSPQRTGTGSSPSVAIDPASRARFTRLFAGAGPSGGLLDGDKAKDILVKSKLPFDKLGAIWSLADTKSRGALDLTDFIIAMHYIQQSMNGSITTIPATLPPGLYESAAGVASSATPASPGSPLRSQATGGSAFGAGAGGIPRQFTGQQQPLSPSSTGARSASGFASPLGPQRTGLAQPPSFLASPFGAAGPAWAINSEEKAAADKFFDALDTTQKGLLEGSTVVPFFMQSQLNEQALAHVWDLSDVTQSGSLTKDEFAVAMHLIKSALAGNALPQELPADLVPPSLRNEKLPEPVNPQQTETQKDLFSLMDDDEGGIPPPTTLPVSAASAFGTPAPGAPVAPGTQTAPPAPSAQPHSRSVSSPFDDDFFSGGGSGDASIPAAAAPAPSAARSTTAALPADQSAEYGNKSLQFNSTQKAVDELQSKRSTLESGVAQNATSLAELETRLASVKSTHETESRLVKDLEARRDKQAAELKTLRDQLISEESELSRLKAEKDEIEQQVLHDREEVRDSKKRMTIVQTELNALKVQLEKLRKEARQQKGLVAIGKKQLSTAEGDKEKIQKEIESGVHPEEGEQEGSRDASAHMPGGIESVTSPTASVRSYNPFDRTQPQQQAQTSTPASPSVAPTAALAAVGGAAAATAGVAAVHHHQESEAAGEGSSDPFGASRQDQAGAAPAADPWASNATSTQGTSASAAAFDDAFGDDFAPSGETQPPTVTQKASHPADQAAFDDAFGDAFGDDAHGKGVDPVQEQAIGSAPLPENPGNVDDHSKAEEKAFTDDVQRASTPDAFESNVGEAVTTDAEPSAGAAALAPAPTADQVATDADVIPTSTQAPAVASVVDAGAPGAASADTTASADDDSDEDDDDEGPEDVENFRRRAAAAEREGSPDESGFGKAPTTAAAAGLGAVGVGAAAAGATALPSATTATQASNRFPELPPSDPSGELQASIEHQATNAGEAGATNADTATASEPLENSRIPSNAGSTDSIMLSSQNTGSALGDSREAFVDAQEHEQPAAAAAAVSPALSVKTRRAPPPAPIRASGASAGVPAVAVVPATAVPPTSEHTSFDDFEASFADFGASSGGQTGGGDAAAAASGATGNGFDDAFDDADFDFVPSFGTQQQQQQQQQHQQHQQRDVPGGFPSADPSQQAAPAGVDSNAFSSFDDAFGDFGSGVGAGTGNTTAASQAAGGANNSSSGGNNSESSAFSFEDAFAPPANVSLSDPATAGTASAVAAPSLPARGGATSLTPSAAGGGADSSAQRAASPALADDAGPVRQLAAMGFPRHKVIAALEKSNYRTEKALERLLAES